MEKSDHHQLPFALQRSDVPLSLWYYLIITDAIANANAVLTNALTDALAWLAWRIWGPLFTRAWRQGIRLDAHRSFHNSPAWPASVLTETDIPDPHPIRRIQRRPVP